MTFRGQWFGRYVTWYCYNGGSRGHFTQKGHGFGVALYGVSRANNGGHSAPLKARH